MLRLRRAFLGLFALVSSCGPASEGAEDTAPVAAQTQGSPASTAPHAHDEPTARLPALGAAQLVGFAGTRFAIIDTPDETLVFDAETSSSFAVAGHAVSSESRTFDVWANAGFTTSDLGSRVETSADGARLLVRTEDDVRLVDLLARGAVLAGSRHEAGAATLAPDGETFALLTDDDVTFVRVADGARMSHALGGQDAGNGKLGSTQVIDWTPRTASWTDPTGAHVVDRATLQVQHIPVAGAALVLSKSGDVAAVFRSAMRSPDGAELAGVVEIWRRGETSPAVHVESAHAADLVMDASGRIVAWLEHDGQYDAKAQLHTLDLATGARAHFAGQAEHCSIAHEQLVGIENGELLSDGECSPGCPSITSQSDMLAYDVATGRVVRRWRGPLERSFNERDGERRAVGATLAARYGLEANAEETLPLVHHPKADVVLVPAASDAGGLLRLVVGTSGAERASLAGSAGFPLSSAHFWPTSGAQIVAVRDGEIAVWDAASGRRVWATTR